MTDKTTVLHDKLGGKKTLEVASILDEMEKDRVKGSVDIVALFSSFGVALTKKGKGYSGKCPWHDDDTPSLSVDREKGLYHCFGCGASGDAFTLVETMKGCSFKDALAYLKGQSVSRDFTQPIDSADKVPADKHFAVSSDESTRHDATPTNDETAHGNTTTKEENAHILDDVCARYAEALAKSTAARAYLEKRAL